MFGYYALIGWRALRRNPALTVLMVLAIAIGIGASITTLTVLRALSGDPLPDRSSQLFYVQLDPRSRDGYIAGEEPPDQLTYADAMRMLDAARAEQQAVMSGGASIVQPQDTREPFLIDLRFTSADFFSMFGVPFLHGSGWSAQDDRAHARVVVISRELNDELFGGANSVGRTLRMDNADLSIVGVIDRWRPRPHFYDLGTGHYVEAEDAFVPLETAIDLKFGLNGNINCWRKVGPRAQQRSPHCSWLQYWVKLSTPERRRAFANYLENDSAEQRQLGRFERPPNVRVRSLMEWLEYRKVVPSDVRLQAWLALGFLLVCLVNTVGLMLAKFLRRSSETAVRRALGASRRAVFHQLLVEAGIIGIAGAVGGLLLALAGLQAVRMQQVDYADLARMDAVMLALAALMSVAASLLAGILPAWRACRIDPAPQLKSG